MFGHIAHDEYVDHQSGSFAGCQVGWLAVRIVGLRLVCLGGLGVRVIVYVTLSDWLPLSLVGGVVRLVGGLPGWLAGH